MAPRLLKLFCVSFGLLSASGPSNADETPDSAPFFESKVRPVLARCVSCHGLNLQEAHLRLDTADGLSKGGDSGPAIVAGNLDASRLVRLVRGDDETTMPPEEPLSAAEVDILSRWVGAGAVWPESVIRIETSDRPVDHWAFEPIVRAPVPAVADADWPRDRLDRFVLARLEAESIRPSPPADRSTLLRRVTLDLIGLPPTPREIGSFLVDRRPEAYERVVDRLLSSPRFGERWGRHWLDAARYADSSGYESDKPRAIWAYRDWVIDALNDDMPFDRFVVEQLAGDLLPEATRAQTIATGFHCNAMLDPGVREEAIIDRVNTTGQVFLGLTLGCAQCHSHKTDPVSQREFYRLYAFFNEASITDFACASGPDPKEPITTLVMKSTPQATHLFIRGEKKQLGEKVSTGVPAFLHSMNLEAERPATRLDLARWIMEPENPLTARVTVNRVWQQLFGRGLVATESDFGIQTPPPSHPELLDCLADEFRSNGWSLKRLLRRIVTSATYRQCSDRRRDLETIDPDNVLLARQRRLRVEAEIVRDLALATSGLLTDKMRGPSVFPWQPDGVLNNRATPATWTVSANEDRYRRGLYTWVWRLTPHPHAPLFDAPDGVTACTRRERSNVPVQALTLLNDPTFLDCARNLARRVRTDGPPTTSGRIDLLYRLCLSRRPDDREREILGRLVRAERDQLASHPDEVAHIAGIESNDPSDAVETAVWVIACRAVLNLDEFISRE